MGRHTHTHTYTHVCVFYMCWGVGKFQQAQEKSNSVSILAEEINVEDKTVCFFIQRRLQ